VRSRAPLYDRDTLLQHWRSHYRHLFDHAPVGLLTFDGQGVITNVNPTFLRLWGDATPPERLKGTADVRRQWWVVEPALERALQDLIRHGRPAVVEGDARVIGDRTAHFVHHLLPMRDDDDTVMENLWMVEDVTERKQAEAGLIAEREEALQQARIKGDFLANISHELRTPLNAIIGFLDLVENGMHNNEAERQEFLQNARLSAINLLELINTILDLAKIEAGRLTLEAVDFDLPALVEEVARMLMPQARGKSLELLVSVDPAVPRRVRGDPSRLRQVLFNLVGNAVKFTNRGRVTVRCRLQQHLGGEYRIQFVVEDTGIGISTADQDKLFQSFTQLDDGYTRRFGGTGLGLAITKEIAEMMGGEVGVNSAPGEGSTFWFTAVFDQAALVETEESTADALAGVRLLLVHPDGSRPEGEVEALTHLGARLERADSAEAAVERLQQAVAEEHPVRAVLVDHMAELSRVEDLARLVREHTDGQAPELVYLTAGGEKGDAERLHRVGYGAYLSRPLSVYMLKDALSGLLRRNATAEGTAAERRRLITRHSLREERQGRANILVAEDNPVNQKLINAMLTKQGYGVTLVGNGEEAVTAVADGHFHLVLMDVQMPVMDGLAATREIRKRPGGSELPVIAMTANALDEDRERCFAAGIDDYLTKPVIPNQLYNVLNDWLGRARNTPRPEAETGTRWRSPHLDVAHLDNVRAYAQRTEPAAFEELVLLFEDELEQTLRRLDDALKAGDWQAMTQAARHLQSVSAGFGAMRLREAAQELEALSRERLRVLVQEALPRVRTEAGHLKKELSLHFGAPADTSPTA